jgi:hypothetical protein
MPRLSELAHERLLGPVRIVGLTIPCTSGDQAPRRQQAS